MPNSFRTSKCLRWVLILMSCLLLAGCKSDGDTARGPGWPAVGGIYMVDENGDIIGIYGSPVDGGLDAYPNPSDLFAIRFDVPYETRVIIWTEHAVGPGETTPTYQAGFGNALVAVNPDPMVGTLVDEVITAGPHVVMWSPRRDGVPSGWYRISARMDTEVTFCDVFYAADFYDIPPGMLDRLFPQW